MAKKIRSIHGHYSDIFEDEARRIQREVAEQFKIDITWTEATSIAGMRSQDVFWNDKKLKEAIARLRGL